MTSFRPSVKIETGSDWKGRYFSQRPEDVLIINRGKMGLLEVLGDVDSVKRREEEDELQRWSEDAQGRPVDKAQTISNTPHGPARRSGSGEHDDPCSFVLNGVAPDTLHA